MNKTLIIAEKPSVGRDIAKVLGVTQRGDGYLYSDMYVVSWAIGHLVTLFDPEDYDAALKGWKRNTLPIIPEEIRLKGIKNTAKQLTILKKLMNSRETERIVCATDSGREGELIFRYIYELVKCKKPFDRLWISSMTDTAIKEGFRNLKSGSEYDNLYLSARCRSEADWLVGINATRAFTIKYNALLSIGRVQTPTLAIIAERQKEINEFVPRDYWEVKGFFTGYNGLWFSPENNETKIYEEEKAGDIVDKVRGKQAKVVSIENEEKKQPPWLLYDLTELQRDCNRKYGFSAKKTLGIAQDLYEKRKMITYPRTDSRYVTDDMIPKLTSTLRRLKIEPYEVYVDYVLGLPKLPVTRRIVDNSKVSDHHAIIPTDVNCNLKTLSGDELKVYDLIARRFISVFYPPYIYNVTKIVTMAEGESFLTKGTTVVQWGFMELYKNEKNTSKKKEEDETADAVLPEVGINDEVTVEDAQTMAKKTKPPKAYNEATLLSAMENAGRFVEDEALKEQLKESGIGTPATRAAIIERLLEVGYITRNGKILTPTEKGMKLIEVAPPELKSPETTGKWERGLNLIARGQMDMERFMQSIRRYVAFLVQQPEKFGGSVVFPREEFKKSGGGGRKPLGKCPVCQDGRIYENTKAYFCNEWQSGCKFTIWKNNLERYGLKLTVGIVTKLLKDKKVTGLSITLPQTMEAAVADLELRGEPAGMVELVNVNRNVTEKGAE